MRQGGRKSTRSVEDWTYFKSLGLLSTKHFDFLLICDLSIPYAIGHMSSKMKLLEEEGEDWEPETFFFGFIYLAAFARLLSSQHLLQPLIQPLHCTAFRPTATNSKDNLIAVSKFYKKYFLLSLLCFDYEHISVPSMCDLFIEDTDLCDSIIICGRINSS